MKIVKKSILIQLILVVMLCTLVVIVGTAQTIDSDIEKVETFVDHEGNVYTSLGIKVENPYTAEQTLNAAANSSGMSKEQFLAYEKLRDDRMNIRKYLESIGVEYGGGYTESGKNVILLTEDSVALDKEIISEFPENLELKYVKYSHDELERTRKAIEDFAINKKIDIIATGINKKQNKINIYISPESFEKYKDDIEKQFGSDKIHWEVANMKIVNTAVSAGDSIEGDKLTREEAVP